MNKKRTTFVPKPGPPPVCTACNGSGRYDVKGSPKCASCNGTGLHVEEDCVFGCIFHEGRLTGDCRAPHREECTLNIQDQLKR